MVGWIIMMVVVVIVKGMKEEEEFYQQKDTFINGIIDRHLKKKVEPNELQYR